MKAFIKLATVMVFLIGSVRAGEDYYQTGQAALRAQDYQAAIEAFEKAQRSDQRIDAAAYWYAYALRQAGRERQALQATSAMLRRFPASEWADDARALQAELGGHVDPGAEEELRLYALYHLMEANPERGMALLRDMLGKTGSAETKRHLLFLMAGQDDVRMSNEIISLARDAGDPELQVQAIHVIAASGNSKALAQLAELYSKAADRRVRRAVIDAHIASDAAQALAAIVRREPDLELKRHGIMALGAMDATGELKTLYPTVNDARLRQTMLEAFAISGDTSELAAIIKMETDPKIRAVAIRSLGISGASAAADMLDELALKSTEASEQNAILEALIMLDHGASAAVTIARHTSHPEVRQQAIRTLAMLDATDELLGVYEQIENPDPAMQKALLQALSMADAGAAVAARIARESEDPGVIGEALHTLAMLDASTELGQLYERIADPAMRRRALHHIAMTDADQILKILESESDPALRAEAIRALPHASSDTSSELVGLYPDATSNEKRAIIDALTMADSDLALSQLLDIETDTALQRHLLEALLATGSERAEDYLFKWLESKR